MTASEIPLDGSEVQPSTNPLVRWSEGLALWQRDALRRIADPASLPQLEKLAEGYPKVATQYTLWEACAAVRSRQ